MQMYVCVSTVILSLDGLCIYSLTQALTSFIHSFIHLVICLMFISTPPCTPTKKDNERLRLKKQTKPETNKQTCSLLI